MSVFESMSAAERSLRARTAVHTSWANTTDRSARARGGVEGALRKLEDQIDPEHLLAPAVRRQRAESLRKARMADLARQSAKARRERKAAKTN
jgi:predicted component of type VI protein secretion system